MPYVMLVNVTVQYSGVNESDEKDRGQKMYAGTYIF